MHGHKERWRGGEHQLQAPEAHVRDGEEVVVARVLTAWLQGVAHKVGLLVPPHALHRNNQHSQAEDEEDRQPDSAQAGGLAAHPRQLTIQQTKIS
uniref:Uncharacterized protein n=1 Tax=Denticeps clupeoides TaxID=299321 RepID=A0A8C4B773_9TELE